MGGIASGDSTNDDGGNVELTGGLATAGSGGTIKYVTGFGIGSSSGFFQLATNNAGDVGVSGYISMRSGFTSAGDSGYVEVQTGDATDGTAGYIEMDVGNGNCGAGGDVEIIAGSTRGADSDTTGGSIRFFSGYSTEWTSGPITLETANAGVLGVSGALDFTTGTASEGNAGQIGLTTGRSIDRAGRRHHSPSRARRRVCRRRNLAYRGRINHKLTSGRRCDHNGGPRKPVEEQGRWRGR